MNLLEAHHQEESTRENGIRICIPVIGKSVREFIGNMKKAQRLSNLVELRTDFIESLKPTDILLVRQNTGQESIFTCRRKTEGGRFDSSERERIAIIDEALRLGFGYVDIELSTLEKNQLDLTIRGKTKLIVSYHNFEETPDEVVVRKLIENMKKYNPDIIKVATQVVSPDDNYKLFKLMLDESIGLPRILIGMGELGIITRIIGPILGNYLTFASTNNQVTAPGQIDINRLKRIYKLIGVIS